MHDQETQLSPRRSAWRWPSIQNYQWVRDHEAEWFARTYFEWIDRHLPWTRAVYDGEAVAMSVGPIARPAIQLQRRCSTPDLVQFEVVGGWLVHGPDGGTFEFGRTGDGAQVVLRDYRPALPRIVYFLTQAMVHAIVMWLFGKHLRRKARGLS